MLKSIIMRKIKFTLLFLLVGPITLKAQVVGFKILNQTSTINSIEKTEIQIKDETEKVFRTLEIIQYNYLQKEKVKLGTILSKLENELYKNSIGADSLETFEQDTIRKKTSDIKRLRTEIKSIDVKQDSLYFLYTRDYLKYKHNNILNFGKLRSEAFFDMLYGDEGKRFKALGNAGVYLGENSASIFSELVSGNLGLFRVSFGSMITNSKGDSAEGVKNEQAFQRLVTYGGNTVLNLEYPLMYVHSRNNQYNLITRLIAKGAADLPAFGTSTETWAGSGSFGIDIYGDASLSNNQLRFFFNLNANQIYGSDIYRSNLGISNTNFTFGQLSLGLVFLENFKISFILFTFSSEASLENKNVIAGGQVLR
jgi:hypothetical protein